MTSLELKKTALFRNVSSEVGCDGSCHGFANFFEIKYVRIGGMDTTMEA